MEIPIINRVSDFENGMGIASSFIYRLYALSGIQKIYGIHRFLKWGALILALITSIFTIINKLKILIIRPQQSLPTTTHVYDTDFGVDSDSSSDSDEESEYEEEEEPSTSRDRNHVGEFFRIRGSSSDSDECEEDGYFTSEKGVVKLWENLSLGFGFGVDKSDDVFNGCDVNKRTNIASIFGGESGFQTISAPFSSPAVVISAGVNLSSRRVAVGAWDTRLCCRVPAIVAEWKPKQSAENIAAVNMDDGDEKVYVIGNFNGKLTVGDVRMGISLL